MSDLPFTPPLSLSEDVLRDPSRNGHDPSGSILKTSEDYSIFVGSLVPVVGRPVVIVTYERSAPSEAKCRRETATYWAFFSHERASLTSALCQRTYVRKVSPRLGAMQMTDRARDEAELALSSWLATGSDTRGRPAGGDDAFALKKVDPETLFGLYVFSAEVQACVEEILATLEDRARLRMTLAQWTLEAGVNTVPLHTPTQERTQ